MSQNNRGGSYDYKASGENSSGNHYCSRDYGNGSNSYHYSNRDGSYYYANPDGSTYYNTGSSGSGGGYAVYTPPPEGRPRH
jgi:hypothetical protein